MQALGNAGGSQLLGIDVHEVVLVMRAAVSNQKRIAAT